MRHRLQQMVMVLLFGTILAVPRAGAAASLRGRAVIEPRQSLESTWNHLVGQWWTWLGKLLPGEGITIDPNG